jgi:hypothetical protein
MSKPVYINKALFHMLVVEWFKRVIEGYEDLEDDQGVGGGGVNCSKSGSIYRYLETDRESTRHSPTDNSSDV